MGVFSKAKSAEDYYNLGNKYYDKKKLSKAIDLYNQVINIDPNYVCAYVRRGYVFTEMGNFDQAIIDFTKAIELDSTYYSAYKGRADAYRNKGDILRAEEDNKQFLKLYKMFENELAYKQASELYEKARGCGDGYYIEGDGEFIEGKYYDTDHIEAISLYGSVIYTLENTGNYFENNKIHSLLLSAYNERGIRLVRVGRIDDAIADWQAVLQIATNKDFIDIAMAKDNLNIIKKQN